MPPDATMQADTPFSYRCTRCNACCTGKRIQVNPYEIARLARARGVSTGETRERFTEDGALKQDERDSCVFLGEQGCTVHPDRPLVCRLFPLGRTIAADGSVSFGQVDPSWARGDFGEAGVVAGYVEAQGAGPFIAAADAYFDWFCRASTRLAEAPEALAGTGAGAGAAAMEDLLDIDTQLGAHCAARGLAEPVDPDGRMHLHLALLDQILLDQPMGEDHV